MPVPPRPPRHARNQGPLHFEVLPGDPPSLKTLVGRPLDALNMIAAIDTMARTVGADPERRRAMGLDRAEAFAGRLRAQEANRRRAEAQTLREQAERLDREGAALRTTLNDGEEPAPARSPRWL